MAEQEFEPKTLEVVEPQEVVAKVDEAPAAQNLELDDVMPIPLRVTASLGHANLKVSEVIALKVGSLVTLDKMAGEMTDIYVNELPLAKGEVVVINDILHVRIAEVSGRSAVPDRSDG